MKVQKSLVSGGKVKDELMKSLAHIKYELQRQQQQQYDGPVPPPPSYTSSAADRQCVASQTDLCTDNYNSGGAKLAEMAKTKFQYTEWRKRIKELQQKLAEHVEKIEPGQLESDKDRLLLIQEKEHYLNDLRSIPLTNKCAADIDRIKEECLKLEIDLNNAYEFSNQCIANRLKLHEEKQILLQQLQDAVNSTKMLEERLRSFSSGSTFSISSGSSLGSLSTASSKNSLSALSFTDIYGDPLTVEPTVDMSDLHRRTQRLSHPSEVSLSPRSSLSVETPPASPMKDHPPSGSISHHSSANNVLAPAGGVGAAAAAMEEEPMYANSRNFALPTFLDNAAFDCLRLEERLNELEVNQHSSAVVVTAAGSGQQQQPLSPIYEKPLLLDLPPHSK